MFGFFRFLKGFFDVRIGTATGQGRVEKEARGKSGKCEAAQDETARNGTWLRRGWVTTLF